MSSLCAERSAPPHWRCASGGWPGSAVSLRGQSHKAAGRCGISARSFKWSGRYSTNVCVVCFGGVRCWTHPAAARFSALAASPNRCAPDFFRLATSKNRCAPGFSHLATSKNRCAPGLRRALLGRIKSRPFCVRARARRGIQRRCRARLCRRRVSERRLCCAHRDRAAERWAGGGTSGGVRSGAGAFAVTKGPRAAPTGSPPRAPSRCRRPCAA
jgi:hypothetical protein